MPWRQPKSIPFTRIDIVSTVPAHAGVYGIMDANSCVFVGESWNLRARLLELANALSEAHDLSIVYEICGDDERFSRKAAILAELIPDNPPPALPVRDLPGLYLFD